MSTDVCASGRLRCSEAGLDAMNVLLPELSTVTSEVTAVGTNFSLHFSLWIFDQPSALVERSNSYSHVLSPKA